MSFSIPIPDNTPNGVLSLPTQKSVAFRQGTIEPGEIYVVVPWCQDEVVHRYFYKCVNNLTLEFLVDWAITVDGDGNAVIDSGASVKTVSFVIDEEGRYLHAVTHADPSEGGNYHHMLVYGVLDLDNTALGFDDTVLQRYYTTEPEGYQHPDIILDHRTGDKKPIIVTTKNQTSGDNETHCFIYDSNLILQTRQISGLVSPTGNASVAADPNDSFYFVHATNDDKSHLYKIPFLPDGVPSIPLENQWIVTADVDLPNACVAMGNGDVGFVAPVTGELLFKRFTNEAITASEQVYDDALNGFAYGLFYRGNIWHSLYCPFGSTEDMVWRLRDPEIEPHWVPETINVPPGSGEWDYFCVTTFETNPEPRHANEFGCMTVEISGGSPYPIWYVHVDDWEVPTVPGEGNYWKYGTLIESKIFAFDIDTGAAHIPKGNSRLKVMGLVEIGTDQVFTDQSAFMEFNDTHKEWVQGYGDTAEYTNKEFTGIFPPRAPLNNKVKILREVVIDYAYGDAGEVNGILYIFNEKGQYKEVDLDGSNVGDVLKVTLFGKEFYAMVHESSQEAFKLLSIKLRGSETGALV